MSRVARRTAGRLGHFRRALASAAVRRAIPAGPDLMATLQRAAGGLSSQERERLLHGPDVRGFLADATVWVDIVRQAERLSVAPSDRRARSRLFERIASTEYLTTLLPRGRIDGGCAGRAVRFGRRRLRGVAANLAAAIAGIGLARPATRPIDLRLEFHEEPEIGQPGDRIDLGTLPTAAGPLSLVRSITRHGVRPGAGGVRLRIENRSLIVRRARGGPIIFPAAASPLRFPSGTPERRSRADRTATVRLMRRPTIPGTSIILAPRLHSSTGRLSVGRQVAGLDAKLGGALRALGIIWPEMRAEVARRTALVIPIYETGLVSYSLAARPGVSFINVFGKQVIELADDLLHETAHHLLHDVEEIANLLVAGPDTSEVQAFDSPWRGTLRPLHGLLHGCYTFLFRAELLIRLRDVKDARTRLLSTILGRSYATFARREARRELRMLRDGLRQLEAARRAGLLSLAGRRLVRSMGLWYAHLSSGTILNDSSRRNR